MRTSKDEAKNKQRRQEKGNDLMQISANSCFSRQNECSKKTTEAAKNDELV